MAPLVNSITHLRKNNSNSMQTFSENSGEKNTSKIPLYGQYYSDTKNSQEQGTIKPHPL